MGVSFSGTCTSATSSFPAPRSTTCPCTRRPSCSTTSTVWRPSTTCALVRMSPSRLMKKPPGDDLGDCRNGAEEERDEEE